MLYQIIIVIHGLIGFFIIGLVLMQQGKGADAGAAFGNGGSGSVFGAQGSASFLSRTTAILAACFFTTSLGLAVLSGHQAKKPDLIESITIDESKADVPLAQSQAQAQAKAKAEVNEALKAGGIPAAEVTEVPSTSIPAAPAIKEVEQAPAEAPKAE